MNIFVLDRDPSLAAKYHCDKHVVKMILETAQILSTVDYLIARTHEFDKAYKPTHINHPCTVWASLNSLNYGWLVQLGMELCKEYEARYGRVHACFYMLSQRWEKIGRAATSNKRRRPGTFVMCMSVEYQQEDPVAAYRAYYLGAKRNILKYKNGTPSWVVEGLS